MTTQFVTIGARRAAAGAHVAAADLRQRLDEFAHGRVAALTCTAEQGAQAAEYAMLGGVSAAACSALVAIFKNRKMLESLVESVITTLGTVIEGWF